MVLWRLGQVQLLVCLVVAAGAVEGLSFALAMVLASFATVVGIWLVTTLIRLDWRIKDLQEKNEGH